MSHEKYASIGLETEVLDASPHRLIQMMYERLVKLIHLTRQQMIAKDIPKKCQSISKALDIIGYLKMSLNFDHPEAAALSERLDHVYSFVERQLIEANMKNDPEFLDIALEKILTIKSAWDSIADAK